MSISTGDGLTIFGACMALASAIWKSPQIIQTVKPTNGKTETTGGHAKYQTKELCEAFQKRVDEKFTDTKQSLDSLWHKVDDLGAELVREIRESRQK